MIISIRTCPFNYSSFKSGDIYFFHHFHLCTFSSIFFSLFLYIYSVDLFRFLVYSVDFVKMYMRKYQTLSLWPLILPLALVPSSAFYEIVLYEQIKLTNSSHGKDGMKKCNENEDSKVVSWV